MELSELDDDDSEKVGLPLAVSLSTSFKNISGQQFWFLKNLMWFLVNTAIISALTCEKIKHKKQNNKF